MANFQYDEGGGMAAYFILTFLSLVLIPLTYSLYPKTGKQDIKSCQCSACIKKESLVRKSETRSLFSPKLSKKAIIALCGWALFAFVAYKVSTVSNDNKLYDPFEILGLRVGTSDKDIKSHYKKLSRKFHPDKVKLAANQTVEAVEAYFVELTKAYKSLTDETIRKNWEQYGHPDGRQADTVGIAIPSWVVEGQNKFLVLALYCVLIGGFLPVIVGRWWFGSRNKTKDGVLTKTAAVFFKNIKEDSSIEDLFDSVGTVSSWEAPVRAPIETLEAEVRSRLGGQYKGSPAQTLLFAHVLRIEVKDSKLVQEQRLLLDRMPTLLNSLLNISMSHNWLTPTLSVMRLHAFIVQALEPVSRPTDSLKFAQLPNFNAQEAEDFAKSISEDINFSSFADVLEKRSDPRLSEAKVAAERVGKLDIVDASFKVLGERIVTPSAIVHLVVKLRMLPPSSAEGPAKSLDETQLKRIKKLNDERDNEFLSSRKDGEDLASGSFDYKWAHAPFWPRNRKASWWLLLADDKADRIVIPPLKLTDVPLSDPAKDRDYRAYKIQFQAPQGVGMYTWKIHLVSDTYIGEEYTQNITLQIDDVSALTTEEQAIEDEISDPEEDSLAGQMAAMRGGSVKKSRTAEESDDESSTDDDEESGSDSSDSD